MGKWSNKTCFICGVRRPIFRMKQEIITQKTGHIGFGLSFNPARKKSARIQLPRNRYSKTTKWICKDKVLNKEVNSNECLAFDQSYYNEIMDIYFNNYNYPLIPDKIFEELGFK